MLPVSGGRGIVTEFRPPRLTANDVWLKGKTMRTNVIIEPWKADEKYVHCRIGHFNGILSHLGDCLHDISVSRFIELALSTGKLREVAGKYSLDDTSCNDLCEVVDALRDYSDEQIATARGQLEDEGSEESYTDLEVAWIDYSARQILAEEARELDNPYDTKSRGVEQMLSMQEKRHGIDRKLDQLVVNKRERN